MTPTDFLQSLESVLQRAGASVPVEDEVGSESHVEMPAGSNGDLGDNAPGRMRFATPFKAGLYSPAPAPVGARPLTRDRPRQGESDRD
jgi:hypothetical protein